MAERQAFAIARPRSLLDTEAVIYSIFTSECTFTAVLRPANKALCYRARATGDATTMQVLPVRQGLHRLPSTVARCTIIEAFFRNPNETQMNGANEWKSFLDHGAK